MAQPTVATPESGPNWDALLAGPQETPAAVGAGPDWDHLLGDGTPAKPPVDWNGLDAVTNGLLLGAGPYIMGASRSIRKGTSFSSELAKAKGARASYAEENPLTSSSLEIAGSLPTVGLATAASPELVVPAALGRAAPLAGRAATMGLRGAEAGVLQTPLTGGDAGENAITGAGVGAAFPLIGAGVSAAIRPVVDNGVGTAVQAAQRLGFNLRPGQYAMPGWLTKADRALMGGRDTPQLRQYTRVLSHSIGEDTDSLTPEVLERAQDRIGQGLDAVAANSRMVYDATLHQRINDILYRVTSASGISRADQNAVRNVIQDIRNSAAFTPARRSGQAFQQLTQYGSMLGELSQNSNPTVRQAGGDLSDALFETVARYSPSGQTQALFDLKDQYRNVLALRKPVGKAGASGLLNPKDIASLTSGTPAVRTMGQVGKFLPSPSPSGSAKPPSRPGFFPSALRFGAAAGAVSEAHEIASWAVAHPGLTTAAAASALGTMAARPAARAALGSQWLENLALGHPAMNPLGAQLALPAVTGAVNQQ